VLGKIPVQGSKFHYLEWLSLVGRNKRSKVSYFKTSVQKVPGCEVRAKTVRDVRCALYQFHSKEEV